MDENNKFDVVGTNIAEKATMIWNVAAVSYTHLTLPTILLV